MLLKIRIKFSGPGNPYYRDLILSAWTAVGFGTPEHPRVDIMFPHDGFITISDNGVQGAILNMSLNDLNRMIEACETKILDLTEF